MMTYLIVCPLVGLAGFVDAIAGGGGLISLPAYMLAGIPAHNAIASNKLSAFMGTSLSSYIYFKKGYMKLKLCVIGVIAALLGAFIGAKISLFLDEELLKRIMIVVLPCVGLYVLRGNALQDSSELFKDNIKLYLQCFLIALIVGCYDGLYGPGTGTFLMLLLTGVCHLTLNDAQGTTKAINLTTNFTSLAVFAFSGKVLVTLGLCAGICGMIGNYLGSSLFVSKGSKFAKPITILVITIFIIKLLFEFYA